MCIYTSTGGQRSDGLRNSSSFVNEDIRKRLILTDVWLYPTLVGSQLCLHAWV